MNFLKFRTTSVHLFERKVTSKIIGKRVAVPKANNISWKINNKSPYAALLRPPMEMKERVSKLTYPTLQHCLRMLYTMNGNSKH